MTDLAAQIDPVVAACLNAGLPLSRAMKAIESRFIQVALAMARGNVTQASRSLGVHRNTVHSKIREPLSEHDKELRSQLRTSEKKTASIKEEMRRRDARRK